MEDREIITLYNARDDRAVSETDVKYGPLCRYVAGNILSLPEDAEEAVQDAYLGAWNAIPPTVPRSLRAFMARLTRNASLKKYDRLTAKRRGLACTSSLEELSECVSGRETPESELENRRIEEVIGRFVRDLSEEKRYVFLRRYWYFDSVEDIGRRSGFSASKVANMLYRMRKDLRETLLKEDIEL